MHLSARQQLLFADIEPHYDNGDPSHDRLHILRVVDMCLFLAQGTKADLEILIPAAFLHDLVNVSKDSPLRSTASAKSAHDAFEILQRHDYSEVAIAKIQTVIVEHSYSLNGKPTSVESEILQDADKLDALGAIGILRTATVNARMKSSYYEAADPFAATRALNDRDWMLDHYETKLFKLTERMNTKAGSALATERTAFMRLFLTQLKSEIPTS